MASSSSSSAVGSVAAMAATSAFSVAEDNQTAPSTMMAAIRTVYGEPSQILQMETVDRPAQPGPGEVCVAVRASSIGHGDVLLAKGQPWVMRLMTGVTAPSQTIFGLNFAGDVVAVGEGVEGISVGDAAYGAVPVGSAGSWAEYVNVKIDKISPMPNNIGYHEAATLPTAACTALKGLRDTGGVGPGSRVLINGATGAVGTYAVQIARALGASHVAAVCSERHVDFVESLGADAVIPYQTSNYTETEAGGHYDVVFDLHSNHSFADNAGVMVDDGTLVMAGGPDTLFGFIANAISKKFGALFCSQSAAMFVADAEAGLLADVTEMVEDGAVVPHVSRVFGLAEAGEAFEYRASERPPTITVIEVAPEDAQ